jgi:hypothetical protein
MDVGDELNKEAPPSAGLFFESNMKKEIYKSLRWLTSFFINYSALGFLLLLIAIILDLLYPTPRELILSITINTIHSIGLAILVASIFSFASGTSTFIEKIKELLEDIVIKRNFLGNIDPEGKKEALKSLIQPSAAEKNKYPNIGDYYGYFINKTLEIGKKSVRSNYQINSRAFYDSEKGKIAVEGIYSYRLYPSSDGYNDITVGFEEPLGGDSFCSHVAISTPDGNRKTFKDLQLQEHNEGGDISSRATISIQELGNGHNHLDVELKVTEYGSDHWSLITFKALQPTDGFKFYLHCDENVLIREHAVFVVGASYYIETNKNKKSIAIGCNQWINEGSGLSIVISTPHDILNPIPESLFDNQRISQNMKHKMRQT